MAAATTAFKDMSGISSVDTFHKKTRAKII
jgi:hypothetical protein